MEGFESSAMTAAPILYELAVNPDIQERLHQELEDTLGDKFDPDFETLHNGLPYLHQIVHGVFIYNIGRMDVARAFVDHPIKLSQFSTLPRWGQGISRGQGILSSSVPKQCRFSG